MRRSGSGLGKRQHLTAIYSTSGLANFQEEIRGFKGNCDLCRHAGRILHHVMMRSLLEPIPGSPEWLRGNSMRSLRDQISCRSVRSGGRSRTVLTCKLR